MIEAMLEEQLRILLTRALTDMSILANLLATYVHFKCVYLGAAYQVAIKIRRIQKKYQKMNQRRLHE